MGHVFARIETSNPRQQDRTPIAVTAMGDTGALMLCIPETIATIAPSSGPGEPRRVS